VAVAQACLCVPDETARQQWLSTVIIAPGKDTLEAELVAEASISHPHLHELAEVRVVVEGYCKQGGASGWLG